MSSAIRHWRLHESEMELGVDGSVACPRRFIWLGSWVGLTVAFRCRYLRNMMFLTATFYNSL